MKEIELVARLYNNRLKERREAMGLSQVELAKKAGMGRQTYGNLETLRGRPIIISNRSAATLKSRWGERVRVGDWHPYVIRLAEFFRVPPEELFPPITHEPLHTSIVKKKLNEIELRPLIEASRQTFSLEPHEEKLDREAMVQAVTESLDRLKPKERKVLKLRFGIGGRDPKTLKATGATVGVSTERTRQIEQHALRKLHSHSRDLKMFLPDN